MAAGVVAALSGYIATTAIMPEQRTVHAFVLASSWHTHTAIDEAGRTRDLEVTGPDTARA